MTKLDVITGFLGAGKTTLIRRYLSWLEQQGLRACVIENEYGAAGVDSAVLSGMGAAVEEISGGCVCCTMKVTLHELLCRLAGKVDRIILEPSGLFCGDDLLDILSGGDVPVEPGMWCGVVDPLSSGCMESEDRAVLQSELMQAGSILISKTALASAEEFEQTRALLADMLPPAPLVLWEDWDALDWAQVFPQLCAAGAVLRPHTRRRFDHVAMFQSTTVRDAALPDSEALEQWLWRLLSGEAGQVLRIKGTVMAGVKAFQVNCTPRRVDVSPAEDRSCLAVNVIGRDLNRRAIRSF